MQILVNKQNNLKEMDILSKNYCRLCIREASRRVRLVEIEKHVEQSFYELTQIKLSNHPINLDLSNSICEQCLRDLDKCNSTRKIFIEKQTELEKKAMTVCNEVNVKTENDTTIILDNGNIKVEADCDSKDSDNNYIDSFPEAFLNSHDDSDDMQQDDSIDWAFEQPVRDKKDHQTKKKSKGTKQCSECGSVVKNLVEHLKYTHNQVEKSYFCDHCSFSCYFRQKMEIHLQKHIPKEFRTQISCLECNFVCGRKDTLKKHMISMHQTDRKRNFTCPQCDKSYYTISQVNSHVKAVHQNIRNYACQHCDKRFFTSKDLNLHVPRHFEKKEKCPQCDSLFYTQPEVLGHIKRVHLPPTAGCTYPGCTRKFPTQDKLKIHIKVVHEKIKEFVCVECGANFGQYNTMKRHVDTVHRSFRVQCPIENCTFSMKRKEKFKNHLIKYHPNIDEQGRQEVIKSLIYKTEVEQEHIKEFPCPECGKMFTKYCNLKKHIAKGHVKKLYPPKLYRCPLDDCSYSVKGKYRLRKHLVKTHHCIDEENLESILKNVKYES